jgi:uncharacterized protein YdbL (DUF1318 family)
MLHRSLVITALIAVAIGCVVIPSKFEADIRVEIRHIQEQAGDLLDFIEGETEEPEAMRGPTKWERFVDAVRPIHTAHAQALSATSDEVKKLANSMRERIGEVNALKASKSVGEDNRGYLHLQSSEAMEDADAKNAAQKIVAAENDERKKLYTAIAEENRKSNAAITLSIVEGIYADERLGRAKSGEIVQLPPSGERFEKFKDTSLGKKLGDDAKANAWVTVP